MSWSTYRMYWDKWHQGGSTGKFEATDIIFKARTDQEAKRKMDIFMVQAQVRNCSTVAIREKVIGIGAGGADLKMKAIKEVR